MMTWHIVVNDQYIGYDDICLESAGKRMREDEWAERAKNLLKAELKRRGVSYRDLAEKLTAQGTNETERNIANKISRGGFTAAFFIQCLTAIGCQNVRLDDH